MLDPDPEKARRSKKRREYLKEVNAVAAAARLAEDKGTVKVMAHDILVPNLDIRGNGLWVQLDQVNTTSRLWVSSRTARLLGLRVPPEKWRALRDAWERGVAGGGDGA